MPRRGLPSPTQSCACLVLACPARPCLSVARRTRPCPALPWPAQPHRAEPGPALPDLAVGLSLPSEPGCELLPEVGELLQKDDDLIKSLILLGFPGSPLDPP